MTAGKKILYVTIHSIESSMDGIAKKIRSQIAALRELGNIVDVAYLNGKKLVLVLQNDKLTTRISLSTKNTFYYKVSTEIIRKNLGYDLIYIRNPMTGPVCLCLPYFLKSHTKTNTKIVIEVPTYPYDSEMKTIRAKISLLLHRVIRKKIYKYTDFISYIDFA